MIYANGNGEQDCTMRRRLIDVVKQRIKHADHHFGLSPHSIDDIGRWKGIANYRWFSMSPLFTKCGRPWACSEFRKGVNQWSMWVSILNAMASNLYLFKWIGSRNAVPIVGLRLLYMAFVSTWICEYGYLTKWRYGPCPFNAKHKLDLFVLCRFYHNLRSDR